MGVNPRESGEEPARPYMARDQIYTGVESARHSAVENVLEDFGEADRPFGNGARSFTVGGLGDLSGTPADGVPPEPWPGALRPRGPVPPGPAGRSRRRHARVPARRRGGITGRSDRPGIQAGSPGARGKAPQGGEERGGTRPGGYNPALDGLRAIAVACVLCYHMAALKGGYLGVDAFLVLSGFLITSLLLAERDRAGAISLKAFYVRRAFRLTPAYYAFVVIGAVLVVLLKTHADQLDFLENAVTSLLYVNDYFRIFRPDSGGAWFGHVWSLSLEEQFYLLWPVALVAICRREQLARRLPAILFGGAVLVACWRAALADAGVSGDRTYFALDTRSDSLLIGCALAAWLHASRLEARAGGTHVGGTSIGGTSVGGQAADGQVAGGLAAAAGGADGVRGGDVAGRLLARVLAVLPVAGPLALVALAAEVLTVPANGARTTIMDRGGYTVVALLFAVLILALDQGRPAWLLRALGCRPLAWAGRISYGFYLWHFPVTGFAGDKLVVRLGRGPATVVAGLVAIGLAAASYYLLEQPIQRRRPKWASSRLAAAPAAGTAVPAGAAVPAGMGVPAAPAMPATAGAAASGAVGETTLRLRYPRRHPGSRAQ